MTNFDVFKAIVESPGFVHDMQQDLGNAELKEALKLATTSVDHMSAVLTAATLIIAVQPSMLEGVIASAAYLSRPTQILIARLPEQERVRAEAAGVKEGVA